MNKIYNCIRPKKGFKKLLNIGFITTLMTTLYQLLNNKDFKQIKYLFVLDSMKIIKYIIVLDPKRS